MKELKNLTYAALPVMVVAAAIVVGGWACRQNGSPEGAGPAASTATLKGEARRPLPRRDAFFGVHFDLHPNAQDTVLGVDVTKEMVSDGP